MSSGEENRALFPGLTTSGQWGHLSGQVASSPTPHKAASPPQQKIKFNSLDLKQQTFMVHISRSCKCIEMVRASPRGWGILSWPPYLVLKW